VRDVVKGHDPIDEAFRRMRRRSNAVFVILSALFVALIARSWIASPPPLDLYTLANIAIFIIVPAALLIGGKLMQRGLRRSLEMVRSRVREAGAFSFLHIVLALDNGLVLQLPGSFAVFSAFFSSNGSPLSPSLREARRWMRPFRWIRLVTVRAGKETPELTAIRGDLGAKIAAASVGRCKPKGYDLESNPPTWIAYASFGLWRPIGANHIVGEADRIARYLQGLVQVTLSRARAVPPPAV